MLQKKSAQTKDGERAAATAKRAIEDYKFVVG